MSIRFEDLSRGEKFEIFQRFIKQRSDDIEDIGTVMEWVEEYGSEYKLNGRQIRNIISSARCLESSFAGTTSKKSSLKALKFMARMQMDFGRQLESVTMDSRRANEAKGY